MEFINERTKAIFVVDRFKIVVKNGVVRYFYKDGSEILDPRTGEILKPVNKKGYPEYLKLNDKSKLQKVLKERSKMHYKKYIHERKIELNEKIKNSL